MGIIETYSRATQSSNLIDDAHHHATEKLAAVALAGEAGTITRRLGNMLFRVKYANDGTTYAALKDAWTEIVIEKAALRGWPKDVSARKIARLSLDYWHNDICTECGGTGHKPLPHIPNVLSDDPCPACNGTAKKPIQVKHNLQQYVEHMVDEIECATARAGGDAMRKLAADMDL